ncbi:MAG: helix-turn-helix domain-containing protein [Blastocatellia bacterium]
MIRIHLHEVLQEQNRTLYWLAKQTGVRYATVWNLSRGKVGRLSMDALDRICGALSCQPGDLLVRANDTKTRKGKERHD